MECQKEKTRRKAIWGNRFVGQEVLLAAFEPGRAAELGSRVGVAGVYNPEGLTAYAAPTSAADLLDLLAQSIVEIRMVKPRPETSQLIGYLGAGLLRALELADLESGQWGAEQN